MISVSALILFASLAHGQSTATASVPLIDQIQISNLGKDTRDLLSGRYRQTGKPTFAGGFCFADGTCQTTAAGNGVIQDTTTVVASDVSFTATTFGPCIAGSTVTFTTSGSRRLGINVRGTLMANDDQIGVKVLLNGEGLASGAGTQGQCQVYHPTRTADRSTCSIYEVTGLKAAGTYSICVSARISSGTGTFLGSENRLLIQLLELSGS